MELKNPIVAYVAEGNIEAHAVAQWLISNGVDAYAIEDNSGVSLWELGRLSQFHNPKVWIEKSDSDEAKSLLDEFEARKRARQASAGASPAIASKCEECGETSEFPAAQNGTTQTCPKCDAFMDVGETDWPYDTDFGEPS